MSETLLVVRAPSGLSGDMFLAGLSRLAGLDQTGLDALCASVNLPDLAGAISLVPRAVQSISGHGLEVRLPHVHEHRHLEDIRGIVAASSLTERAKELSLAAFGLLADAEAHVHGVTPDKVHFHEVGALDSILDVCLTCALFDRLSPDRFVCGPLPVCDGVVHCGHGVLSTPAPASLRLLEGLPVVGIESRGETLTPTALSLLKALGAQFGPWPAMVIERQERIYGSRVLPGVPNGAVFAWGTSHTLAVAAQPHGHHHHRHGDHHHGDDQHHGGDHHHD